MIKYEVSGLGANVFFSLKVSNAVSARYTIYDINIQIPLNFVRHDANVVTNVPAKYCMHH